jgi:hypothetical protein
LFNKLDHELADMAFGLLVRIEDREARAFRIVCRGMQSVESAFWDRGREMVFERGRSVRGSDRPSS